MCLAITLPLQYNGILILGGNVIWGYKNGQVCCSSLYVKDTKDLHTHSILLKAASDTGTFYAHINPPVTPSPEPSSSSTHGQGKQLRFYTLLEPPQLLINPGVSVSYVAGSNVSVTWSFIKVSRFDISLELIPNTENAIAGVENVHLYQLQEHQVDANYVYKLEPLATPAYCTVTKNSQQAGTQHIIDMEVTIDTSQLASENKRPLRITLILNPSIDSYMTSTLFNDSVSGRVYPTNTSYLSFHDCRNTAFKSPGHNTVILEAENQNCIMCHAENDDFDHLKIFKNGQSLDNQEDKPVLELESYLMWPGIAYMIPNPQLQDAGEYVCRYVISITLIS